MDDIKLLWESLARTRKETDILIRGINHRVNILENDVDKLKEELDNTHGLIMNHQLDNKLHEKKTIDNHVHTVKDCGFSQKEFDDNNIIDDYLNR